MSRVRLALDVDDLDASVAFYAKLFGAEPAKLSLATPASRSDSRAASVSA